MESNLYHYKVKEVVKVIDGDTVELLIDLGLNTFAKIRARLLGVDTPEIFHPKTPKEKEAGIACKEFLKSIISAYPTLIVKTHKDRKGKYGRYLVEIYGLNPLSDKWDNLNKLIKEFMRANHLTKKEVRSERSKNS